MMKSHEEELLKKDKELSMLTIKIEREREVNYDKIIHCIYYNLYRIQSKG